MSRVIHLSIDVTIDRFPDRVLERQWLPMFVGVETVEELRDLCREARANGQEVFPIECPTPKPDGHCPGHEVP